MTRTNKSEMKAYRYMKEQIISGAWSPARRIVEQEIAEELGMSRSPVRSAIIRLESEGLVNCVANRGAAVGERGLSPQDIADRISVLEYMICLHLNHARRTALRIPYDDVHTCVLATKASLSNRDSMELICHNMSELVQTLCYGERNQYFYTIIINIIKDISTLAGKQTKKMVYKIYTILTEGIQEMLNHLNNPMTENMELTANQVMRKCSNDIQVLLFQNI